MRCKENLIRNHSYDIKSHRDDPIDRSSAILIDSDYRQVSLSSITKANVRTLHVAGFHSADKYQLRRTSTMAFLAFGD